MKTFIYLYQTQLNGVCDERNQEETYLFQFDLSHVFETVLWTVDTFLCSILSVAWLCPGDTCTHPAWFSFPLLTGSLHY